MRITGYCTGCHRIRTVRVTRFSPGRIQKGVCDACQAKEDERRRTRRNV